MKKYYFYRLWQGLALLVSVFINSCGHSSLYDQRIVAEEYQVKALIHYSNAAYDSSLYYFNKMQQLIMSADVDDYFYAAAAALHIDDEHSAEKWLTESIVLVRAGQDYINAFYEFHPFRTSPIFTKINQEYDQHLEQYFNNLPDRKLVERIDSMISLSHNARRSNADPELLKRINDSNIQSLIEITKKNGWPSSAWMLLWDQRFTYDKGEVWGFFKKHINKEIKEGKMARRFWANFEDDSAMRNDRQQIYGTNYRQYVEYPIVNINEVDKLRASIGLAPIWLIAKLYKYPLPIQYEPSTQE